MRPPDVGSNEEENSDEDDKIICVWDNPLQYI